MSSKINLESRPVSAIIIGVSVIIPVVVAFLIFSDLKSGFGEWVKVLPHLHAIINSITTALLITALIAAKRKYIPLHRLCMSISFFLGVLFLISYITYHSSVPSVIFGDVDGNGVLSEAEQLAVGSSRRTYLMLLLSHIGLSVVVVPLVLLAFYHALNDRIEKHRKIVKYTWPVWFYVSLSGVFVYLMISPYYQ